MELLFGGNQFPKISRKTCEKKRTEILLGYNLNYTQAYVEGLVILIRISNDA